MSASGVILTRFRSVATVIAVIALAPTMVGRTTGETSDAVSSNPAGSATSTVAWQLLRSENFATGVTDSGAPWFPADDGPGSVYDVDGYDDDGGYFDTRGGPAFRQQLLSFDTYRKSFAFGEGGWLTAELSARDADNDGRPDGPPSLRTEPVTSNRSLLLNEPNHHGGVIIRSTEPLPPEYRIEVRLRTLEFGGQRDGSWDYADGRINGYKPKGCKTNHPWAHKGDFTRRYCKWSNVRTDSNGFYFLSIMDYPRPAPHNNVFIHTHRKVVIDGYNRYKWAGDSMVYCNPLTRQYEPYSSRTGNGVNMLFNTTARHHQNQPGTAYLMHSECGFSNGLSLIHI